MLLDVQNFSLQISTERGRFCPVDSLSFSLVAGQTLAIVGESGCGKSLTALSLLRLYPVPQSKVLQGRIAFEGQDLLTKSDREMEQIRGRDISMIFQEPMTSLNPVFTIGFQIQEVLETHFPQMKKAERKERTIEMLRKVGIGDSERRYGSYPHELSGGMRQRVMIAMALISHPKLLIADEPTTALDVTIQAQVLELIKSLQKEMNMAVILITHDLGIVNEFSDEVLVMYAGKVAEWASTRSLFDRPLHPYTQGLLQSLPSSQKGNARLRGIPGTVTDLYRLTGSCRFLDRCSQKTATCQGAEPNLEEKKPNQWAACYEV